MWDQFISGIERRVIHRPRPLVAYAVAIALAVLALALRLAIDQWMSGRAPFATFFPVILLAAVLCGGGPGLAALLTTFLGSWFFVISPRYSFDMASPSDAVALGSFAVVGLLLVLVGVLLRRVIERLVGTETRLRDALDERTVLLREINHRITNNLQIVASFLQLQAGRASPEARDELRLAQARIRAVATIHSALYRANHYDRIDMAQYIRALATELATLADGDRHVIRIEADSVNLPISTAVDLGLITNELLTNAMKYAYVDGEGGPIVLRLSAESGIRLEVEDQGRGLPADFDPARSGGIGMSIVQALVGTLKGTFSVHRASPGTRFVVDVPGAAAS